MVMPDTIAGWRADLESRGYVEVEEATVMGGRTVRPGDRVRNRGHQYTEAFRSGTADVVAIYDRSGRGGKDVEIVIQRDDVPEGQCILPWPDYGTVKHEPVDW